MKYEYLCGYESDFFAMPANVVAVVRLDHCVQGLTEFSQITECGKPVIAMRRIIPEPKHWTKADQLAGRLPPVGSKYLAGSNKREFTCLFHGKGNGAVSVVGFNSDDEVTGYQLQYCYPIESPEEKAARLEDEFTESVMRNVNVNDPDITSICDVEMGIRNAYRKISGDLPAPVKGE